jgi:signal transduction histidine kinase
VLTISYVLFSALCFGVSSLFALLSVRVPFNAIVLGVEQLRENLYTEPLRPLEEMQDVVNILNDQSKVVARVLNDCLSVQKIQDGALRLDMAPLQFGVEICGTVVGDGVRHAQVVPTAVRGEEARAQHGAAVARTMHCAACDTGVQACTARSRVSIVCDATCEDCR